VGEGCGEFVNKGCERVGRALWIVQNMDNRQVVFVATSDANVFAMRLVRLGPESNGFYPVLEGLSVGDRIVTEGSFILRAEWLKSHPSGQ